MSTLFKLDDEYLQIANEIELNEGELTPELEQKFDELCDKLIQKETAYLHVYENFNAQIELGKKIVERISKRIKSFENQQARLKNRLLAHMIDTGREVIETEIGKIRLQESEKVIDMDLEKYPTQYIKIIETRKVDKTQLKKDAKSDPELYKKYIEKSPFIKIY